jgi:hypothetical protein
VCLPHDRKRETELLAALEGVIQRCRELEEAQYIHAHELPTPQLQFGWPPAAAQAPGQRLPGGGFPAAPNHTPSGTRSAPGNEGSGISTRVQQLGAVDKGRSKSAERRKSRAWH